MKISTMTTLKKTTKMKTSISSPPLHKLIYDMDSATYHATPNTYSSSQFKDCLDDEELFFKKHIEKSIARTGAAAFDVGNYFHTGTLEPHKLSKECAVYPGNIRRGEKWERFQKKHAGKVFVTKKQVEQAEDLIKAVQDSPVAMGYLQRGKPEVSAFLEIAVHKGEIYAPKKKLMLTREGWVSFFGTIPKDAVRMIVKTRADSLGEDFVLDLKSTTGNAKSVRTMRDKISYYNYDLSAALYLDVFEAVTGRSYDTFIWTFASKDYRNSRSYVASEKNILVGRAKYRKAILKIADGLSSNWVFSDVLGILEPNTYELENIVESELDLV